MVIGVEVKNTLSVIPADEVDIKIEMCGYLGIIPVFAVRWNKPRVDCIRRQGGFSWIFKTQMFPLGYEEFVSRLYKKLSLQNKADPSGHVLEFPVSVRTDLPPKSVNKFEAWADNAERSMPRVNASNKCGRNQ